MEAISLLHYAPLWGQMDPPASAQVCDQGQQLVGQAIFGYHGVYQVHCPFRNIQSLIK
jgi:hypothetical protein